MFRKPVNGVRNNAATCPISFIKLLALEGKFQQTPSYLGAELFTKDTNATTNRRTAKTVGVL